MRGGKTSLPPPPLNPCILASHRALPINYLPKYLFQTILISMKKNVSVSRGWRLIGVTGVWGLVEQGWERRHSRGSRCVVWGPGSPPKGLQAQSCFAHSHWAIIGLFTLLLSAQWNFPEVAPPVTSQQTEYRSRWENTATFHLSQTVERFTKMKQCHSSR